MLGMLRLRCLALGIIVGSLSWRDGPDQGAGVEWGDHGIVLNYPIAPRCLVETLCHMFGMSTCQTWQSYFEARLSSLQSCIFYYNCDEVAGL